MRHLLLAAALLAPVHARPAETAPSGAAPAATGASAAAPAEGPVRARFDCDDGRSIEMRFAPRQGVAVLVDGRRTHRLRQQRSGSGYRYAGGPVGVRGQGRELWLQIGRRAPVGCRERGGA